MLTCVAVKNEGIDEIVSAIEQAKVGKIRAELQDLLKPIMAEANGATIGQAQALLIAEGDEPTATACGVKPINHRAQIYGFRRSYVNTLVEQVVEQSTNSRGFPIRSANFYCIQSGARSSLLASAT